MTSSFYNQKNQICFHGEVQDGSHRKDSNNFNILFKLKNILLLEVLF